MKSFSTFLSECDMPALAKHATEAVLDPKLTDPLQAALQASTAFSISLLRAYHEWLAEQLD